MEMSITGLTVLGRGSMGPAKKKKKRLKGKGKEKRGGIEALVGSDGIISV